MIDSARYRSKVREFLSAVAAPAVHALDLTRPLGRASIAALATEFRQHPIATAEPTRGRGEPDLVAVATFVEELHRLDASIANLQAALCYSPLPLWQLLDAAQQARYRHCFGPGRMQAVGFSEPGAGSNPAEIATTAHRCDDGDWIIEGRKLWTSNATVSDLIYVGCRVAGEPGLSIFLVDRDTYQFDARPVECLGFSAISTCEVAFHECRVGPQARVGVAGAGLKTFLILQDRARLNVAAGAVGIAQAALDDATARVGSDPVQVASQIVHEVIADMAIEVETARLLVERSAALVQDGLPARAHVSMAKAYCTEAAARVAGRCVALAGPDGLDRGGSPQRLLRDARMYTIPDGTTQIHKLIIGRELLGVSALRPAGTGL